MSMFNSSGEINASSVKEAMAIIAKYASILEEGQPSNLGMAKSPSFSDSKKDDLINRALNTQDGKIALAQAMASPIRRNLDYHGMARRALVVDVLEQGVTASYDRDIDVSAVVISSNGSAPESRVFGDRVVIPEFEIVSNPTIRIAEAKRRRFNAIDRAVQKARQEIMAQEDANIFAALEAASQVENVVTDISDAGMLKRDLSEIKKNIDRWDLVTTKFFMHINEFNEILNWSSGGGIGDLDPVTQREILQTGMYGKIWGSCDILVSKVVPPGTIYGCADPEFVGVLPIRQDIEILPADEPRRLSLGWVVSEVIGLGIVNPRGCASAKKSAVVG
jgi:hypothetical protein